MMRAKLPTHPGHGGFKATVLIQRTPHAGLSFFCLTGCQPVWCSSLEPVQYTSRHAQLNPNLVEPKGHTCPSRQVPGRGGAFSNTRRVITVSPLYSFQHCLVSLSSFCASLLLFIPPPSLSTASPSSWLGSLYLLDLLCCFCLHTRGPEVAVVPKQDQM